MGFKSHPWPTVLPDPLCGLQLHPLVSEDDVNEEAEKDRRTFQQEGQHLHEPATSDVIDAKCQSQQIYCIVLLLVTSRGSVRIDVYILFLSLCQFLQLVKRTLIRRDIQV